MPWRPTTSRCDPRDSHGPPSRLWPAAARGWSRRGLLVASPPPKALEGGYYLSMSIKRNAHIYVYIYICNYMLWNHAWSWCANPEGKHHYIILSWGWLEDRACGGRGHSLCHTADCVWRWEEKLRGRSRGSTVTLPISFEIGSGAGSTGDAWPLRAVAMELKVQAPGLYLISWRC